MPPSKDKKQLPVKLKLEFSKASDYDRVNIFFNPDLKNEIDSANYITPRIGNVFRNAINNGSASFLSDEKSDVMTLVVDYQVHMNDNHAPNEQHDYTELATVMSRVSMRGFQSATLVVSATALKEWWVHPPKHMIITGIKHDNLPPRKISEALEWEVITDHDLREELFYATYKTAIDETGQNRKVPIPTEKEKQEEGFYACLDNAIIQQAKEVLKFMDAGSITNKKTCHSIPVDLSAMEDIGLTRPRLEAIANGNISRSSLKKTGTPAP